MRFASIFIATTVLAAGSLALPQDATSTAKSCGQLCAATVAPSEPSVQSCATSAGGLDGACLCAATPFVNAVEACMASRCPTFAGTFAGSCRPTEPETGSSAGSGALQDATYCGQLCAGTVAPSDASVQKCTSSTSSSGFDGACLCAATSFVTSVEACMADRCPSFAGTFAGSCKALAAGPGDTSADNAGTGSRSDAQNLDDKGNGARQNGAAFFLMITSVAFVALL
ncbi:hypothetical protein AURDEDRAFT_127991 [Auricularia subglabra TFB-10046 SS5]|nr:hypothetical protein AURDEDRAFT_127991 [Auricularia subglabra TFB-10046 SS5]